MTRRRKSNRGIFFGLVLGIIIGVIGFYSWKNYQPQLKIPLIRNKIEEIIGNQTQKESPEDETQEEVSRPEISREEIMEYVTKDISNLSPVKPALGGKWGVINFWLADDFSFYVDYEDGHILRRLLISVEGKTENPEYKIIGFFEPGDDNWVLKEGKDTVSDETLDLYGWDEKEEKWAKIN